MRDMKCGIFYSEKLTIMAERDLKKRTKKFAHRCVKLAISLPPTTLGNHVKGQLIRSATSVAANYRATCLAQTPKAFIAKISIPIEEADESSFWIEFVIDEELLSKEKCSPLLKEAGEITAILISSRKTSLRNLKENEDKKKKKEHSFKRLYIIHSPLYI